ncbi:LysR family transcriptional regulator [Paraburkholderia sp. MPAMCS5]|uniref:LysR family transcriptional regulator n=1 Tax=Paraburkholderia sp. MPAMCS5 TaxID=3112563 RepID=UPI002E19BEF4|nr:LysR family transcriptional regulator [Paraburkholderia sp. MPAMCS5]
MDLKQMRYFQAVAEERNFGRAAERLHIAQPPLTRHIQALEAQLGVTLFLRSSRGAELTEAGETLLAEVPNILALAKRAEEQTQLAGQGLTGRLDVGIFSAGILQAIPQLLAAFHTERPQVKIGLHNLTKMQQLDALRERRINIGFNRLVPMADDIAVETVLEEPYLVALYEGHSLATKDAIRLGDLDGERMILYPNAPVHGLAQEIAAAFHDERITLRVEQEVEDVVTCIALVASRFGVCITTASAANLRLPGVVYKPLHSARLRHIALNCLYRRGDESPTLHGFLEVIDRFRSATASS